MQNNPEPLLLQQNMALRQIFINRGLDLQEVMEFAPYDLDLENRRLQCLAEFIDEYERYGSQEAMELVKLEWVFPPIFPCISPESDWLRFERWLQGKPIQKRLAEMVSDKTEPFAPPESIPDDKMEAEINRLVNAIHAVGIGIELQEGLPPRLLYSYLYETLDDTFYVDDVGWIINGCSGYCPGCIQRPWCDAGQVSCWSEDEEAGKMYLTEELAAYVSASPQSLALLQQSQAEEDAAFAKIKEERPDVHNDENALSDEDWLAMLN